MFGQMLTVNITFQNMAYQKVIQQVSGKVGKGVVFATVLGIR